MEPLQDVSFHFALVPWCFDSDFATLTLCLSQRQITLKAFQLLFVGIRQCALQTLIMRLMAGPLFLPRTLCSSQSRGPLVLLGEQSGRGSSPLRWLAFVRCKPLAFAPPLRRRFARSSGHRASALCRPCCCSVRLSFFLAAFAASKTAVFLPRTYDICNRLPQMYKSTCLCFGIVDLYYYYRCQRGSRKETIEPNYWLEPKIQTNVKPNYESDFKSTRLPSLPGRAIYSQESRHDVAEGRLLGQVKKGPGFN